MAAEQFAERRSGSGAPYLHAAEAHYVFNTSETLAAEAGKNNSAQFCCKKARKRSGEPGGAYIFSFFTVTGWALQRLHAGILLDMADAQVAYHLNYTLFCSVPFTVLLAFCASIDTKQLF